MQDSETNKETPDNFFGVDSIKAVDAKYEAQKIAFAPYTFQVSMALRNLGVLEQLFRSDETGASVADIAEACGISEYGAAVLLEFGLSIDVVKRVSANRPWHYRLGKVGFFVLHDKMTRVNMDFMQDICYAGAASLEESIRSGKPEGLKQLGDWSTIYDGLSRLPDSAKSSWFAFDHYYSDAAFPVALPLVFRKPVRRLMDIGGNTAKWALSCVRFDEDVEVTIVDLPGQLEVAMENISREGFAGRIHGFEQNVLLKDAAIPDNHDVIWMSQFLDCFSFDEIARIMSMIRKHISPDSDVYVLEPFWDRQKYRAATFSLQATSLYFTTMANGNSKMYSSEEFIGTIEGAGFKLSESIDRLGQNEYSLLRFRLSQPK